MLALKAKRLQLRFKMPHHTLAFRIELFDWNIPRTDAVLPNVSGCSICLISPAIQTLIEVIQIIAYASFSQRMPAIREFKQGTQLLRALISTFTFDAIPWPEQL